jgi:hypothetical protein
VVFVVKVALKSKTGNSRLTRLSEFGPFERLFTLPRFMKINRSIYSIQNSWATFSAVRIMYFFTKNGLGNILGHLFHEPIWSPWKKSLGLLCLLSARVDPWLTNLGR